MNKFIASITLFRELYENNEDLYGVIGELLKEVIYTKNLEQFSVIEICNHIKDMYGFDEVPLTVIKTSMRKLGIADLNNSIFTITDMSWKKEIEKILFLHREIQNKIEELQNDLVKYFNKHSDIKRLSDDEIVNGFHSFLSDSLMVDKLSELYSAFIIDNNNIYSNVFKTLKEGMIIFEGLIYHPTINEIGSWNDELKIYLETEILFHLNGLNGELYKLLFDDFYKLIEEINLNFRKKKSKKRIRLFYFSSTKDDIDKYFSTAIRIKENKETLDPSKTAMANIINGCESKADIIDKKAAFYNTLKLKGIEIDETNYYDEKYNEYNLVDEEILDLKKKYDSEYIHKHLVRISNINTLRKGINSFSFEKVGYILIAGNAISIDLSKYLKEDKKAPLVSTLDFMTDRFWFKLNKGFGNSTKLPHSFSLYTKAQIVLSSRVSRKIKETYDRLLGDFNKGIKSRDELETSYLELRSALKKPDDISDETVDEILSLITEDRYGIIKSEKDILVKKIDTILSEKDELKTENEELKKYKDKYGKLEKILNKLNNVIYYMKSKFYSFLIVGIIIFITIIVIKKYSENIFVTGSATLLGTILGIIAFIGFDIKKIITKFTT